MPVRDPPPPSGVPDRHVHSEWSWDAPHGGMRSTCVRAVELGVPAIAFTEHADFTRWAPSDTVESAPATRILDNPGGTGDLDIAGYWETLDRCRSEFPTLRIESGVELGEPHLFGQQAAAILAHRPLDRVLGSLHCIEVDGSLVDISVATRHDPALAALRMRLYLLGTLSLVESSAPFEILTHLDYPKRFWPHDQIPFDDRDFEAEIRAVLRALARSGRVLEINTNRAATAPRGPNPGPNAVRWWHEEGGAAVSFGSDAHRPEHVAFGLAAAAAIAEAAGFKSSADPLAFWRR